MQGQGFLKLPRELRDMVYILSLQPDPILPNHYHQRPVESQLFEIVPDPRRAFSLMERRGGLRHACPGLLRVSQQVHQEAAAILYGSHKFDLGLHAVRFIKSIGPSNAALLRHIVIDYVSVGRRGDGRGKWHRKAVHKAAHARRYLAASLAGVQTLKIFAYHARDYVGSQRNTVDIDRGLTEIEDGLVRRLPSLRRTVLVIEGSRRDLCHKACRPLLTLIKELGWTICRRQYGYGRAPEVEEDFDLGKALAELRNRAH